MANQSINRTRTGFFTQVGYGGGGMPVPINNSGSNIAESFVLTSSGARTPGFNSPTRSGIIAPLGYSYRLTINKSEQGQILSRSDPSVKPGQYSYTYVSLDGVVSGSPNWYSNADNYAYQNYYLGGSTLGDLDAQARNNLLTKVKGQNVDMATATAEAGKTMHMVGDAAMHIADTISHLRRGDFVGAAGALGVTAGKRAKSRFSKTYAKDRAKAVGSGWLALQYGWKPLLNDIYGAVNEINDIGINQGLIIHSAVNKSRVVPYRFLKRGDITTLQLGATKVGVRYGVTYVRMLGASQDLPRLGVTNPAVVAWELVPYSFVVDWFLPIGNFLGTLDATLGVQFLNGYRTHFRKGDYTQIISRSNKYYAYMGLTTSAITDVYMSRVVLTDFPSASLPRFKNPASGLHMANALGLLSNLMKH